MNKKGIAQKNELHNSYKIYRNLKHCIWKQLNQYQKYLERHQKYNICEKLFIDYSNFTYFSKWNIDNLKRIANIFNNYFSTIGEKTQAKIKYSHENYTDHLTNENSNAFFLSPRGKEEIKLILSSLDICKATGPYSVPSKNCFC